VQRRALFPGKMPIGAERRRRAAVKMADYTSREDEAFFAAIGRLVLSWGHVEAGLDMFVMVLHNLLGGSPG